MDASNTIRRSTYTWDLGKRLSALGRSPWSYNVSNELTSTPATTFAYDNNGNMLSKSSSSGGNSYAWDFENRMTSATVTTTSGVASTVSFRYDPLGRRIQKISPSGATIYLYDGVNIVAEVGTSGAVVASYAQGLGVDQPLAMQRGGTIAYYQADGLGSVTSLADGTGKALSIYVYKAFGSTTANEGVFNPLRYTGREQDPETGLYYYRARYYDPSSGRFISEDPMFLDGNGYAYVDNNPALKIDPTGYDGIVINYDYYPVTVSDGFHIPICNCDTGKIKAPLGHGAAIAVDPKTGETTYFEYGRYNGDFGNVRQMPVPNVFIGSDGQPTQASLDNLYGFISKHYGHDSHVDPTYYRDADYKKIIRFAKQRMNDKNRKPYDILNNNCKTFARDAVNAGRK